MQANGETPKEKQTVPQSCKSERKTLFAQREIRSIVRDFIVAYLSGQVKIIFPNENAMITISECDGKKLTMNEAINKSVDLKVDFANRVQICGGAKPATPEETQAAINSLFKDITIYRTSQRIEGAFMEYSLETRLRNVEEGLEKVNNLVEEIVEWLMKGK